MAIAWTIYRALCCVTPELEPERAAFEAANARFAERVTMPEAILFALASPRSDFDPQVNRHGLESNIRSCDFFVQILGETATDPAYLEFVGLAVACTADPTFPLRSTAVIFRNPERATAEMAAFRDKLSADPHCKVHDFHDLSELNALAEAVLADWHGKIHEPMPSALASSRPR
jgi:hypothetical protein